MGRYFCRSTSPPSLTSRLRSVLEFGNVIWSPHTKELSMQIERIQKRFTRILPNLRHLPYRQRLPSYRCYPYPPEEFDTDLYLFIWYLIDLWILIPKIFSQHRQENNVGILIDWSFQYFTTGFVRIFLQLIQLNIGINWQLQKWTSTRLINSKGACLHFLLRLICGRA